MRTPPGNLTSTTTAKSMTGMPAATQPWRAGWTAWKKSGRGRKSSMTFSAVSLRGLARRGSCRWISTRSCSTGLWITQRSIPTAGWYSLSATGWKSAQRFKEVSDRGIGFAPDASGRFFLCAWDRMLKKSAVYMEICKKLEYNFNISSIQQDKLY